METRRKPNEFYSAELQTRFTKAQVIGLINQYFEEIFWDDNVSLLKQLQALESRLTKKS